MRHIVCFLMVLAVLLASPAFAGTPAPAGFVASLALAGEDLERKTSVIRGGAELPGKIMMPLYAGDVVFVRDPASRIEIETGDGAVTVVGGEVLRHEVTGEVDTGDSTWSLLATIGGVIGGAGELPPDTMASRGGSIMVPLAIRGANFVPERRTTLWLPWSGGTAPFSVAIEAGGREIPLASQVPAQESVLRLPAPAPGRFQLIVRDSRGQKAIVRVRRMAAMPEPPAGAGVGNLRRLAQAVWLASQADGGWTLEAAQQLHDLGTPAAAAMLQQLASGWRLE